MGYESKVLVGHRFEMGSGYVGFDELAVFDLAKMGWETVNRKHFNDNFFMKKRRQTYIGR